MEEEFSHSSTFATLDSLREPATPDKLRSLAAQIETHVQLLDETSLSWHHIDLSLAEKVAEIVLVLIGEAEEFNWQDRQWIVAVAKYFILEDDGQSDLDEDGLLDDAEAVSFVCNLLDRKQLIRDLKY